MGSQQSKLLRIGIIQDGKIVQERLIDAGESVTVGESSKNTFVFPKTSLDASEFTLFQAGPKGYQLRFTRAVRGRVHAGGQPVTLQKALGEAQAGALALGPEDRGKLTIDDITILFQFVTPPPVAAVKPVEAGAFRPRLFDDDDPAFFGFLGLWSLLAAVFLVFVANAERRQYSIDDLPDRFVRIVLSPTERDTPPPEREDTPEPEVVRPEVVETPRREEIVQAEPERSTPDREMTLEEAQRQQEVREEVLAENALLRNLIGTTGESRRVVEEIWSGDGGLGDLGSALADAGDVRADDTDGPRTGGTSGRGEAARVAVAGVGGGTADVSGGPAFEAVVSTGKGSLETFTGDVSALSGVIQANVGQLRYCYESRLKVNSRLAGRVEVGWTIENRRAVGIYVVANTTDDAELADCIVRRLARWDFPDGADGDVDGYPFIFSPSK